MSGRFTRRASKLNVYQSKKLVLLYVYRRLIFPRHRLPLPSAPFSFSKSLVQLNLSLLLQYFFGWNDLFVSYPA
jgi:hypothetical protein